jgi:hypothetical protein
MIYGRKQFRFDNTDNIYDYVGCPYPIGYVNEKYNIFFSNINIENIIFKGYEDEDEKSCRFDLENLRNEV